MHVGKQIVFVGLLIFAGSGQAGKFTYGINKKEFGKIKASRPPGAMLRAKSIKIQSKPGAPFPDIQGLALRLEQALSSEYTPLPSGNADATLTFAVVSYVPVTARTSTQNETRLVKVGEKPGKVILGQAINTPVFDNRLVPVQYFEGKGSLGLQISVADSGGAVEDVFSPSKSLESKIVVSVNNESQLKGASLPDVQTLTAQLLTDIATQVQARYTRTYETVDAELAVDDELRAGNALASAGNWQGALSSWQAVSLKKNDADRVFNMAVAKEALAYAAYDESRNPDDAEPLFQAALKLYDQASQLDPSEKYFRQSAARVTASRESFAAAREQFAVQQRDTERLLVELKQKQDEEEAKRRQAEQEEEAKRRQADQELSELKSTRPDTPDEAEFRTMIRVRMRNLPSKPADNVQVEWASLGKRAYKLSDISARRVVSQELDHFDTLQQNREEYRQMFADFAADKLIDKGERDQLKKLAVRFELTAEDTKAIESQIQFKEAVAAAAVPKPVTPAPRASATGTKPPPRVTPVPGGQTDASPPTTNAANPGIKQK